jgi:GNAT superfamily N-acetyltransferase
VLLTTELEERIRRCEIAGIRNGIATTARLRPDLGAEAIEVCGGLVAFTGAKSPMSQAVGVGMQGPVHRDDVHQIVEFYESRRTTPCVFVTPFSHLSLGIELAAAGFAPSEYDNVMASDDLGDWAARDPRVVEATDVQAWSRASVEAFMDPDVPKPGDELVACVIASSPGVWPLEVRDGAAIAATAAMDLQQGCAGLFAGSVMAAYRGRGFHLALIHDRIARAREGGALIVRATARPGSASERNFLRRRFTTLYTRTLWERKAGNSGDA